MFNNLKNNINIKILRNNDFDKKYSQNISLNFNNKPNYINNKIVFPKNLKYNHISPEQYNKYRLKLKNEKNSYDDIKMSKNNLNKNNQIQLNLENHNTNLLNNYNNIKNFNKFVTTEQITCKRPNIKIINIISPISKASSYTKVKKYSFSSNLYKNKINENIIMLL